LGHRHLPSAANLWKDGVLIWEDSKDYHYARTHVDGRIIFGGEDDPSLVEPAARDAAVPVKTERLAQKLAALWPRAFARHRLSVGRHVRFDPTMACR